VTKQQVEADIDGKIIQNDQKLITGQILNGVLHNILDFADNGGGGGGGSQIISINVNTGRILLSGGGNIDISTFINSFIVPESRLFPNPLYQPPTISLSANQPIDTYEIGTSLTITLTAAYTANHAGSKISYKLIKNGNTGSPISTNESYTDSIVISGSPVTYQGIFLGNAGTTQLNDDFTNTTNNPFSSQNWPSVTLEYKGDRKIFFGSGASSPTTSSIVRALGNYIFASTVGVNDFDINTGTTNKKYIFCMPFAKTLDNVIDLDAGNLDITDLYILQGLGTINDAAGTSYPVKIYMMETAVPYSSNHRHKVSFY